MTISAGVGASALRKEDDRFLRGRGEYVADISLPGMKDVAFVRSNLAHARIASIEIPERLRKNVFVAKDMSGVKPIIAATALRGFKHSSEPILTSDKVRYVGEIVAMCLANTRAEAEDLASEIEIDYEEMPPIVSVESALAAGAALVHENWGDNIFIEIVEGDDDLRDVLASAPVKVTRRIKTARHCMFPMEGRGVIAYRDYRLDMLTIVSSTQMPNVVQTGIAECLGLETGRVRVISPDVGGGFGYKGLLCREEVALAWLAQRLNHPIRWLEDCREHLSGNANCREHSYHITGYADRTGRLLALDCEAYVDAGAYSVYPTSAALEAAQIASLLPGPYDFERYRCRSVAVATNKCPILPYRGVARTGVCLALESIMDDIARAIGVEPYEVRLRNLARPEQMPFRNVVGKLFDSGDYPRCLRQAVEAIDIESVRRRQSRGELDGRLVGVGVSFFNEQGALGTSVLAGWGRPVVPGYEQATARLTSDGDLEIRVGTHSHGQGHQTTLAQIAHEVLGVAFDRIKIIQGDTLSTPFSTGTYASRSIVMAGGAVAKACRELATRATRIGAWLMQKDAAQARLEDGMVFAQGAHVTLDEIARSWYLQPQHLPPDVDPAGLEATSGYRAGRDSGTFSYAAHAVLVAVDAETGLVEILDYVVVEDGGKLVNPMIVDGQIIGGTAQGIGTCLYESTPFDAQGQPLASTLLDYILPGATEVPSVRVLHMETPSPHTEFGVKGIGEGGAVGPPAAIVSAINDALRPLRAEVHDLPVTPERILQALEAARSGMMSERMS